MVLLLAPASANASVLERAPLAAAYNCTTITGPETDSANLREKRRLVDCRKSLLGCTLGFLNVNHELRPSRRNFFETICVVLPTKEAASAFIADFFELAKKTVSPLASVGLVKGPSSAETLEQVLPTGNDGIKQIISPEPHLRPPISALEVSKQKLSKAQWKRTIGSYLGSSLDATPLVPVPPFTGGLISLLGFVLILGAIIDRWIWRPARQVQSQDVAGGSGMRSKSSRPQMSSTGIAMFLQRDLGKKESVEWVNMVLGKLWKVYRLGLENWLVGLLQPIIDNLQKPAYVRRVEIKQFHLGDEPISVRSVQRRATRRTNDLQYNIGLRYTGDARVLLLLKLKAGILPVTIPVGLRGLDVDGELWVKLRLIPLLPWVGTATWAFVSLPKIKLDLSPFRLFNLMAIPFLSVFLTKLLTEDLPRLFVLPKKISMNFVEGKGTSKDLKRFILDGNKNCSGELSLTLVEARKLNYVPYSKTDPSVLLMLGDQVIKSKRNTQTSVYGPPGSPIWNQDFRLLVEDPQTQRLIVRVQDYFGLTGFTVGVGEVDLSGLQDTVPTSRLVRLRRAWGPFKNRFAGELLLRMTYTVYVEDENDEWEEDVVPMGSNGLLSEEEEVAEGSNAKEAPLDEVVNKEAVRTVVNDDDSLSNLFVALMAELNSEGIEGSMVSMDADETGVKASETEATGNTLLLLGLVTGLVLLVDVSINFSNFLNP